MEETSRQNKKSHKKINKWKWAFLTLVSLVLLVFFFFIRALLPISTEKLEQNEFPIVDNEDKIEIGSSLRKEDAEFIMNSYLEAQMEEEGPSYQIKIEEDLNLSASLKIMGLELPFTIAFDPYATEDGNLQLRARSMELASLSLPVSAVLSALSSQMDLPTYIDLDSAEKMILVDFSELRDYYPYGVELEKIDLKNNDIRLKLFVNKDTLIRALDSEEDEPSLIEENTD